MLYDSISPNRERGRSHPWVTCTWYGVLGKGGGRDMRTTSDGVSRFSAILLLCCLAGLLVRLGLGLHTSPSMVGSDAPFFRDAARVLVEEGRFTVQTPEGAKTTAKHPPAFVLLLSAGELVGLDSVAGQRVLLAVVGTGAVALTGLAGRRLGGEAVGICAAVIAAVHPLWIQPGVIIMSETLQLTAVAGVLWAALRLVDRPDIAGAALVGAALAVALLTRSEAAVAWLLLTPLLVTLPAISWRRRGALTAALCIGTAVLVGPWLIRNQVAVGSPTLSTNGGITLAGSNCEKTYEGPNMGGFAVRCALATSGVLQLADPPDGDDRWSEVDLDAELRDFSISYMGDDKDQTLEVMGARVLRTWTPFHRQSQLDLDIAEGRLPRWQRAGRALHVVLMVPAIAGAALAWRRSRRRTAIVAVFALQVTIVSALVYGSSRMRVAAEPSIALLAAVGIVGAAEAWRRRRRRRRHQPSLTEIVDPAPTAG